MNSKNNNQGRSQSGLREHNERQILALVRRHQALPKAKIAKQLGLSAQAVTVITSDLLDAGLLQKNTPQKGKVGKPIEPLSIRPQGAYGLGLRVDRRVYQMTLIDFSGAIQLEISEHIDYPRVNTLLDFVQRAYAKICTAVSAECQQRILGLGVATPYQLWDWAEEAGAPVQELELWRAFDFKGQLQTRLHLPVTICNDDTAACSAELCFANSERLKHFMYLYLGPFIGGGLVLNQQVFEGHNQNAGAVGSMPVTTASGQTQLIRQSSLYLLEQDLKNAGYDASLIYHPGSHWSGFEDILHSWLRRVAMGISQAALAAMALLDLPAIVIDGALPETIKLRLIDEVRAQLAQADQRGIVPFSVVAGGLGYQAQAIGSANLPIMAKYG